MLLINSCLGWLDGKTQKINLAWQENQFKIHVVVAEKTHFFNEKRDFPQLCYFQVFTFRLSIDLA